MNQSPDLSKGYTILEEEFNPLYSPTSQEIHDEAIWMGINPEKEQQLLWIARDALRAPLPEPWKPCQMTDTNQIFYLNLETGDTTWNHPCDVYFKQIYNNFKKSRTTKESRKNRSVDVDELRKLNNTSDLTYSTTPKVEYSRLTHSSSLEKPSEKIDIDFSIILESKFKLILNNFKQLEIKIKDITKNNNSESYSRQLFNSLTKIDTAIQSCLNNNNEDITNNEQNKQEIYIESQEMISEQNKDFEQSMIELLQDSSERIEKISLKMNLLKEKHIKNIKTIQNMKTELSTFPIQKTRPIA